MNNTTLQILNSSLDPVSRGGIVLFLYLLQHPSGVVGQRQIVQELGVSDRQVLRVMNELEKKGLVIKEIDPKRGNTKIYKLVMEDHE